jgi:UDP-N-acetylmuramyl pentapeptide phosphotransferase/UDP-N-acetylglucosamine-1-phosphate transferase
LIFLADGGAYLIGYLIATLSILLVIRNLTVSPWFALIDNAYPIFLNTLHYMATQG